MGFHTLSGIKKMSASPTRGDMTIIFTKVATKVVV